MENTRVSDVHTISGKLGLLPEPVARPVLIVVSGLPGTGKSFFSKKMAERVASVVLESDALRKALFDQPSYSPEESARLFRAIHGLIENLLRRGISVILDATNLSEQHREYLYNIAERLKTKLILVRMEAPPALVFERLQTRAKQLTSETKSEADWSVYQKLKPTVQMIKRKHYVVDTSEDITIALDKILREANK